jgi:hypothetical protein
MPVGTIASIVFAYVAIAVLLLSLNLFSLWRWWVKASAMVISGLFFVGSYFAITGVLGMPTRAEPPERFTLVATLIVEPNAVAGSSGAIYLWLETLDENNIPSGLPISYELGYSDALADTVDQAQERLDSGQDVEGSLRKSNVTPKSEVLVGNQSQSGGSAFDDLPEALDLLFNDLPPVRLPSKGIL